MTYFQVAPDALRKAANTTRIACASWRDAADKVAGLRMGHWDLGIMGVLGNKDAPGRFNTALDDLADCLKKGLGNLQGAADEIAAAATYFEGLDFEYYQQFGYTSDKIGYTPPASTAGRQHIGGGGSEAPMRLDGGKEVF